MATDVVLKVQRRTSTGKAIQGLRSKGEIPGVVYGQGKEATAIQVDAKALAKAYNQAGTSKLIDLEIEGEGPKNVLFHEVQFDHLGKNILHFDLYSVRMDEKIKTEVPLHFVGDAPAVYEQNAVLLKNLETVEVEALPKDLPENIEIDISGLKELEQSILISDLEVPEGVTILAEPEEMVVKTEAPREEEEEEEIPEGAEAEVAAEHGADEAAEGEGGEKPAEGKAEAESETPPEPAAGGEKK